MITTKVLLGLVLASIGTLLNVQALELASEPGTVNTVPGMSALSGAGSMLSAITSVLGSFSESTAAATTTATSTSSTWSSRPAASGFWTGSDPFSFVPPTYSLTASKSASTVTTDEASVANTASTSNPNADDTETSTPIMSTSISTHTNIVTATPGDSIPAAATTTEAPDAVSTSGSSANKDGYSASVGWFMVALIQCFLV